MTWKFYTATVILLLFLSCAQMVPPSGGKRDAKPPRAVRYIPDSAQVNFSARQIAIVFDEFIQLNDLQKQLVISPPLAVQPEVKVKGKTLLIELRDSLKKNTTYSFNFGSSLRDYTEGNIKEDFQYVFSTGSYIDSLTLRGKVKNAFDMKTEKGILVMLYDSFDDSVPYRKLPSYFSKTNPDGTYRINHIRPGTYKAFALKDANANYLYDVPSEQIAFSDSLITIRKNTTLDLLLFSDEPAKQELKKAYVAGHGHLVFAFAKPADSVKLQFLTQEPKQNVVYEYSKEKDTLHYWFADDLKDSLKIKVIDQNVVFDTVNLKPITLEQANKSARGEKWGLKTMSNASVPMNLNKPLIITFSHPLNYIPEETAEQFASAKKFFDEKILLKEDSIRLYFRDSLTLHQYAYRRIEIRKLRTTGGFSGIVGWGTYELRNWKENSTYNIIISPGTFTDIFGNTNDTIKLNFKTQEEKYYGTLKLSLKMKYRIAYILQLMNEKGELFEPASSEKGIFTYNYLPPGSYKLRIVYDRNGDRKWTTGSYLQKRRPETVIYYPAAITIRSNWDLDLDWKVE